jgi:GGDEF domain-containing protein
MILAYIFLRYAAKNERSGRFFFSLPAAFLLLTCPGRDLALNGWQHPWARPVSFAANTLLIAFNSLPVVAWVAYADYKLFNNIEKLRKRVKYYLIPFYLAVVLLLVNVRTGIVFQVDEQNVYSRNAGIYVIALITYAMIAVLYIRTKKFKKQINGKIMQSIFLVMLLPVAAGIIQMLVYGMLLVWPAFILATLIAFIRIEKDAILRDLLTGLPTREQFEQRAQYLMNKNIGFSVMMADMNDLKKINDRYGHLRRRPGAHNHSVDSDA